MIATVERCAPELQGIGARPADQESPLDLERDFGLVGGDIFHGALSLDQLFSARPMLGPRRLPRRRCPACTCAARARIPGGGVTGAPGHNAARAVVADLR